MLLSSSLISQNHKIKAMLTRIFRLIPINLLLKIIMEISSRQISLHRDNNNLGIKILLLNSILNPHLIAFNVKDMDTLLNSVFLSLFVHFASFTTLEDLKKSVIKQNGTD